MISVLPYKEPFLNAINQSQFYYFDSYVSASLSMKLIKITYNKIVGNFIVLKNQITLNYSKRLQFENACTGFQGLVHSLAHAIEIWSHHSMQQQSPAKSVPQPTHIPHFRLLHYIRLIELCSSSDINANWQKAKQFHQNEPLI